MVSEYVLDNDPEKQLQQACAELSRRLRAGEDCRAESFFDSHPALASHVDYALELILAEFTTRQELGHPFDPADWYDRFPQWRELLERRFRLHKVCCDSEPADPTTVVLTPPTTARGHPASGPPAVQFGRYELLGELGRGGMGVVFQARDTVLGRTVALKMIRTGVLARPDEVERFYREARAAALLNHPHIVALHEISHHEDQHYFTMEYAPGGSLAERRQRLAADPRAAAALVEKVARAVHHAHIKGILHRDLKPGNVLLSEQGEPLVSDFGLAKFLDADAELTQSGQMVGTPAYMAPELVSSPPAAATVHSDIWALGVILYELLTGRRPFAGKGTKEVIQQILSGDPPRPRALQRTLDRGLETIVLNCLEKEPGRRYASAEALADDVKRWLHGQPITARPEGWLRRAGRVARRASRWQWAAAVFCSCFLAALAALLGARSPEAKLSPEERVRRQQAQALAVVQRRLARGETVTLVGEGGAPPWYRWRTEKTRPRLLWQHGPLSVESYALGLMELVPDPQQAHYRFRAEVQHEETISGFVGIYCCHDEQVLPTGTEHRFGALFFADLGKEARQMQMGFFSFREAGLNQPFQRDTLKIKGKQLHLLLAGRSAPWHKLAVEVSPHQIIFCWDQDPPVKLSRARLEKLARLWWLSLHRGTNPSPPPTFAPRGGLGLFVDRGTASFRRVAVEPLPDM